MNVFEALKAVTAGELLTEEQAELVLGDLVSGAPSPIQVAALLGALRARGEAAQEITGFVRAMRARVIPVHPTSSPLVDTCGTGGDSHGPGTFNISTAASLIAAAAGAKVAKHGNRAVSSRSGSADVLEALDVQLTLPPEAIAQSIDEVGIGFMFAPNHHPAMKNVAPIRKELAIRTVFNLLGPLTNPAGATLQVLGVPAHKWMHPLATTLQALGTRRAMVLHSEDGLDEFSTCAPTDYIELKDGKLAGGRFDPADFGLLCTDPHLLAGGDAAANAVIIQNVFRGEKGPAADIVCLNSASVLIVAGCAANWHEALQLAQETVSSGAALAKLEQLKVFTQRHAS